MNTRTTTRTVTLVRVSDIPAPTHELVVVMPSGERRAVLRMPDPGRAQAARWAAQARETYGADYAVVAPIRTRPAPVHVDPLASYREAAQACA